MARARNIKPGFFKNENLAECTPWARLCFAGLWTLADREGRLEDRPKRIKGELFALDSIEVEPLLCELTKYGFIFRYTAQGTAYIQILAFHKHQAPHHREAKSVIPSPQSLGLLPDSINTKPEASASFDKDETLGDAEALGSKNGEARGQNPSDSLIPDSLNLIPDSGVAAVVIAHDWWPPIRTLRDLKMLHGFSEDWVDQQVPSFIEYWNERGEPLRSPIESLFADHCVARSKLRSVAP